MASFYNMMWRKFIADYLTFSRKERIAVLVFCSVTLLFYLTTQLYPKPSVTAIQEDTTLAKLLDTAKQLAQAKGTSTENELIDYPYEGLKKLPEPAGTLFNFDPNTLDVAGWKRLGLRDRTVKTILNYRSKGGHFYKREDLKKIWGLPDGFYERVQEYIQIADAKKEAPDQNFFKTPYDKKERTIAAVDVNKADTAALIALPGIGSKLAQRIINFRDKLGGFYTVAQIGETYGLPDSTFQKLKPYLQVHGGLKKLNLNSAGKDELKAHPYIRWNLANAIVEYRNQHGPFKDLDELKNSMLIDEATYARIFPYLTL
jgi:competence protein ComEA